MKTIKAENVCQALYQTIVYLESEGHIEPSRAGDVLVAPCPVMTVTYNSQERVLFSEKRDANPFFHLVESIWMLAGRDDAATLNLYVRNFGARFSERSKGEPLPENGGRIHDAYGRRWRTALGYDQLAEIVRRLIANPDDRQCVLQMWDGRRTITLPNDWARDAEYVGENDQLGGWLTRPCNTHVYFRVRDNSLEMTVCCRSNDMIWGAHGANAVHFSVLQEYLAARLDLTVGTMYQLSNNAHVYLSERDRMMGRPGGLLDDRYRGMLTERVGVYPMFEEIAAIDDDIEQFFQWHDELLEGKVWEHGPVGIINPWFSHTLAQACIAHALYRLKDWDAAIEAADRIVATDWRVACREWIERRMRA
jgi:thymidylate synthase